MEKLRLFEYDVLIFDWNLPGVSGVELCREYRARGGRASVLMLTANTTISNKEEGLGSGADDYLNEAIRSARVDCASKSIGAQISGCYLAKQPQGRRCRARTETSFASPSISSQLNWCQRNLRSGISHAHRNIVFSAEALLSRVWKAEEDASPEIIRTHIKNLRKKLEHDGKPSIIETVYGVGYKVVDTETV